MPMDPQRMAAILQRVQLARQAGAGGGMPPIGEYNGGGDIVTPQPPMQMQQMPQQMPGQGQVTDAEMQKMMQMRAMQNRMPPR